MGSDSIRGTVVRAIVEKIDSNGDGDIPKTQEERINETCAVVQDDQYIDLHITEGSDPVSARRLSVGVRFQPRWYLSHC